jgi:L-cysteate sulfo-lyase
MLTSPAPLSTSDLRGAIGRLPRYFLGHYPTPLEYAERFSKALGGPQIFIKRDDCTGLAFGGNKTRHNEFLIADALRQGADIIVWGAGVQSNNCRQTAAACAKAGLDIHLVLGRGGPAKGPDVVQGNLLLDHLVGAHVDIVEEKIGVDLDDRIAREAAKHAANGRKVYSWDRHRVKPLAAVSYALCVAEIVEQSSGMGFAPDAIYVSSAGSTGSGVVLGQKALGLACPVRHVAPIKWPWDTQADMARIADDAGKLIGLDLGIRPADIDVTFDYIGPSYGELSCAASRTKRWSSSTPAAPRPCSPTTTSSPSGSPRDAWKSRSGFPADANQGMRKNDQHENHNGRSGFDAARGQLPR